MKGSAFHELEYKPWNKIRTLDFSCQTIPNLYRSTICTCRKHMKTQTVLRQNNSEQSSIDLGVERVKVVRRKKIIVYLPENRGVLNVLKKTSVKCVGGSLLDQNTDNNLKSIQQKDTPKKGYDFNKNNIKIDLKIKEDNTPKRERGDISDSKKVSDSKQGAKERKDNNILETTNDKNISSDSAIEHIYNLQSSSSDNSNIEPISNVNDCNSLSLKNNSENFKSEATTNLRSPTILEKANEILKQGLSWVRESSKDLIVRGDIGKSIHKDVSITSSPPSLIARSSSSTKVISSKGPLFNPSEKKGLKESYNIEETKPKDVKTMLGLWEKTFNFENESNIPNVTQNYAIEKKGTDDTRINDFKDTPAQEHKKSKNIFSFFRKKNKEKSSFKGKKLTTGRCELNDGIVIKIALDNYNHSIRSSSSKKIGEPKVEKNILQQSWLKNFIANTGDSRKSVQLRWDNHTYGTSSNTVTELRNCTFKDASIILKSKDEISPNESVLCNSKSKHNVSFKQNIKACMMPNTICQIPVNKQLTKHYNKKVFSNNGKKVRARSINHIEIFLPARHISNNSSDYIKIHIPEEIFSGDSEDFKRYTDEEVFNIVEYETPATESDLRDEIKYQSFDTGDFLHNNAKDKMQTVQTCREVVIQASKVRRPKVIEVGVITQKDNTTCLEKSIKPQEPIGSQNFKPHKKCDLAENYLRDYCKNEMLPGLDLFTSHSISQSQCQLISLNSSESSSNSNLCNGNNIIATNSPAEHNSESSKVRECKQIHTNHFFSKLRKKTCSPLPPCNIRTCPKDSIEVWKKRKIYACSNKSKWVDNSTSDEPQTNAKNSAQTTASSHENCMDPCADINDRPLDGILKFKGISDCSNCKNNEKLSKKSATVIPDPLCKIPQPPCLEKCSSERKPLCTKKSSPTCHTRSPECISLKSKVSQTEPSETKVSQTKSPHVTPSNSRAICLNAEDLDEKREANVASPITCFCSGDEDNVPTSQSMDPPLKDSSESYNPPPICPLDPKSYCCCKPNRNSMITISNAKLSPHENRQATTAFYQKSLLNVKRKKCNCIGKRNLVAGIAPKDLNSNPNTDSKKDLNNFSDAKPSIKSSKHSKNDIDGRKSRESTNLGNIKEENMEGIGNKKSVMSKSESKKEKINEIEGVNIDEIHRTKEKLSKIGLENGNEELGINKNLNITEGLDKDEKLSTEENKREVPNCDEILKDVYKDPTQEQNKQKSFKSLDGNTVQRSLSVSDIIEIKICLKFRNRGTSKANIKTHCTYNVDEKSEIKNRATGSSQIYQVYQKEGNQFKGTTEDINFTINIQSLKSNSDTSNEQNLNSNYSTLKRDISKNNSEHLLHDHQPTVDFTNSINNVTFVNKQIANFEISCVKDFASSKTTNSSLINEHISENSFDKTIDNISQANGAQNIKQEVIIDIQEDLENADDALCKESVKDIVNRKLISMLKKLSRKEKKHVLKQILETVHNMKSKNESKKVNTIKNLMHAVLTSESDDSERGPLHNSFKPNSCLFNSSNESVNMRHIRSDIKDKITRIIGYNRTGCGCNKEVDIDKETCCCNGAETERNCCCINVKSVKEENFKEVSIEESKSIKMKSIITTQVSTAIKSEMISESTRKVLQLSSPFRIDRQTKQDNFIYLKSDKVLFFLSDSKHNLSNDIQKYNRAADNLQSRKTKRAVLKIYSQRRKSSSIIKLPKFVLNR